MRLRDLVYRVTGDTYKDPDFNQTVKLCLRTAFASKVDKIMSFMLQAKKALEEGKTFMQDDYTVFKWIS